MSIEKKYYELCVRLEPQPGGATVASVWVRLRAGEMHPLLTERWLSGAPTPHQLDLLEAKIIDECHTLVLGAFGVQGVLVSGAELTLDPLE